MPANDASQFARQSKGGGDFAIWYWNRHVLLELRRAVSTSLDRIGLNTEMKVVELGCGNRPYEKVVRERNAQYIAADLPGNPHADIILSDDGRMPGPPNQFDVVLSIQVLEHVPDPGAYLTEVARMLKPGGKLVLSTHGIWVYHPVPNDFWRWTATGLRKTLEDNGFEIHSFDGLVGIVPGGLQLIQDYCRSRLPKWLRKPFVAVMQFLISRIDRLHTAQTLRRDAMIYILTATPRAAA